MKQDDPCAPAPLLCLEVKWYTGFNWLGVESNDTPTGCRFCLPLPGGWQLEGNDTQCLLTNSGGNRIVHSLDWIPSNLNPHLARALEKILRQRIRSHDFAYLRSLRRTRGIASAMTRIKDAFHVVSFSILVDPIEAIRASVWF